MTTPQPTPAIFTRDWLIRAAGTAAAVTVLAGPAISFMAYYMMDNLVSDARSQLGIVEQDERLLALEASLATGLDGLATRLETIDRRLVAVAEQAERALGADGLLELRPGSAYVAEPVFLGDADLRIRTQARRTPEGVACTAQSRVAVFEDGAGHIAVGEHVGPIRQLGAEFVPYEFRFALPDGLDAGRVAVTIETIYHCNGQPIRDVRPPLTFQLRRPGDRSEFHPPGLPMGEPSVSPTSLPAPRGGE